MPPKKKGSNTPDSELQIETSLPQPEIEGLQRSDDTRISKTSARQGRYPSFQRPATSPELFPDGMTDRMASNRLIWEGCNILSQGQDLGWVTSDDGPIYYETPVAKGKGYVSFSVSNDFL